MGFLAFPEPCLESRTKALVSLQRRGLPHLVLDRWVIKDQKANSGSGLPTTSVCLPQSCPPGLRDPEQPLSTGHLLFHK